ncbi:M28 family peptidase [Pseudoxanthomonas helianthi]|uniref:Carboxypeptidase Q n=1 Tax=Pseudoxanthomonas helianthi TaxID=1453541 RepID=A0A940X4F0_9GAMM|nr:M28 family peptidase [Pseudoxanthomonas helianthi]MBP3984439.1 M28 family peptidase [Pseudoxanthomonas helianthi]
MRRTALFLVLAAFTATGIAAERSTSIPASALTAAATLRDKALADDTGWKTIESLTTEVGPRLAGSEGDARAVEWAKAKFRQLGYDKVWTEPVTFPKWVRRSEHGEVLGAHSQKLALTALGGSPGGTVEGEVVRFPDLAALQAAPAGSLAGKIAFVDFQMQRKKDGGDYRFGGGIRGGGPSAASAKGAIAFVMRSAGTDSHRVPHTGMTRFADGAKPIPSAALSIPDADQLARLAALGATRIRVALDCGFDGEYTSQNVIGEITGSKRPDEVVLIGGHLDSWDHGTGAIDDAAGVAITMATGALLKPLKPARTIRVVAFANEEQGLWGGRAYADKYAKDVAKHVIAAESDFGAGHIYGFDSSARDAQPEALKQIMQVLSPLGIEWLPKQGDPESDIGPLTQRGMAWAWLGHDGTNYFDLHHNADDTLDKIDPKDLAQNVAAYVVFTYLAAQADGGFGSAPKAPETKN